MISKKITFCLFLVFLSTWGFTQNINKDKTTIFNNTKYIESFYDDFNGEDLDLSKWERCPEWQRSKKLNAYWNNQCSYLKDGYLVLEARKEGNKFISGAIRSKGRFTQSYGLYKIRFMAEYTSGCVSSFWLTNTSQGNIGNGATDGAEMDIFEIVYNQIDKNKKREQFLNSAIHWDGYGENLRSAGSKYYIDDNFFGKWHEVTFEWTPTYYKAYLDGAEIPYWDTEGKSKRYGGINTAENFLKISVEVTTWGGPILEELFPAYFYIDWVQVYKPE